MYMRKNILVTGCGGGMGQSVCSLLASAGYDVWGLDLKTPEECTDGSIHLFQCDLSDDQSVSNAAARLAGLLGDGSFEAIVHLAGKYDVGSLVEMSEEQLKSIFEINFFGVCRVNRYFLPQLAPNGRILITTSELAPLDQLPFTGIYGITKSALSKYAYSLRMELQLLGIKVVEIRPGAIQTPLLDVSQRRITAFSENTELYKISGRNFLKITNMVEARSVSPEKIAQLVLKILKKKNPGFVYNINRNPLLLLMNLLPDRLQTFLIKKILSA